MNKPILSVLPGPGLCALGKRFPAYVTQERFLGVSGWKLFGTLRKSSGVRRDVLEANLAARDRVAIFAGDLRLPELLALRLLEGLGYHLEPALLVGPEEVGHVVDTDPELALMSGAYSG
jgi:hypothetical protein